MALKVKGASVVRRASKAKGGQWPNSLRRIPGGSKREEENCEISTTRAETSVADALRRVRSF
jgi:hypothetical protein